MLSRSASANDGNVMRGSVFSSWVKLGPLLADVSRRKLTRWMGFSDVTDLPTDDKPEYFTYNNAAFTVLLTIFSDVASLVVWNVSPEKTQNQRNIHPCWNKTENVLGLALIDQQEAGDSEVHTWTQFGTHAQMVTQRKRRKKVQANVPRLVGQGYWTGRPLCVLQSSLQQCSV
jgi:hypothetical protein